jgi:SlyX protein
MSSPMSEDRLIDLETRLAYQEASLQSLSDTLAAQARQIERLQRTCLQLLERAASDGAAEKASLSVEPPPHY